jgi:membrane-bound lytic murein transglycosylase B
MRLPPLMRVHIRTLAVLAAGLLLSALAPRAPAHAAERGGFGAFVASLWPQASRHGVSRATFEAAFADVSPDPAILAKTQSQAEFVKPIWDYLDSAVSPKRVATGRAEMAEMGPLVQGIARRYGVDPYVLLAVWGMESNFGKDCGSTSVIRDLATLAYVGYRGDYFRRELIVALEIVQQGNVSPTAMLGSWAGAMGQTQFMPSAFIRYAVDYDGAGRKDIWSDSADALASTANFLAQHGWVRNWTWGYEVLPPPGAQPARRVQSFAAWAAQGYRRADGFPMPTVGRAALLAPAGQDGPAFLTTKNFYVIKTYNSSTAYALGVSLLSDRIAGEGPLKGAWIDQGTPTASLAR